MMGLFKSKEQKQYEQMQKLLQQRKKDEMAIEVMQQEIEEQEKFKQHIIEQQFKVASNREFQQRKSLEPIPEQETEEIYHPQIVDKTHFEEHEKERPHQRPGKRERAEIKVIEQQPIEMIAEPPKPIHIIHYLKNKKKISIGYWKDWWKEKFFSHRTVLIEMELNNGFHRTFVVVEKKHGFKYNKNTYIFDQECKYYNIDQRLWCYFYHEDFVLPIKKLHPAGASFNEATGFYHPINIQTNINEIKKALENSNITEVEQIINPSTLERFIKSEIAEGIMKGAAINDFLRQMRLIIIINLLLTIIFMMVVFSKLGVFSSVKIPGINS